MMEKILNNFVSIQYPEKKETDWEKGEKYGMFKPIHLSNDAWLQKLASSTSKIIMFLPGLIKTAIKTVLQSDNKPIYGNWSISYPHLLHHQQQQQQRQQLTLNYMFGGMGGCYCVRKCENVTYCTCPF